MRASEIVALQVDPYEPCDDGAALLRLRAGAPGVTTGSRTFPVADCVPLHMAGSPRAYHHEMNRGHSSNS